jgi:hypothetical protein
MNSQHNTCIIQVCYDIRGERPFRLRHFHRKPRRGGGGDRRGSTRAGAAMDTGRAEEGRGGTEGGEAEEEGRRRRQEGLLPRQPEN